MLKSFLLGFLLFFLVAFILTIIRFRLTGGDAEIAEREEYIQLIDVGQGGLFRSYILEPILGNKRLFTLDDDGNVHIYFVSKKEYDALAKLTFAERKEQEKTYRFKLLTKSLLLGGNAPAKFISVELINKAPALRK